MYKIILNGVTLFSNHHFKRDSNNSRTHKARAVGQEVATYFGIMNKCYIELANQLCEIKVCFRNSEN